MCPNALSRPLHIFTQSSTVLSVTAAVWCVPFSVPLVYAKILNILSKISPTKKNRMRHVIGIGLRGSGVSSPLILHPQCPNFRAYKIPALRALAAQGIHEPCELCTLWRRTAMLRKDAGHFYGFTVRPCSREDGDVDKARRFA